MKASILAIGTELTLGQILNSNAQTLSQALFKMGFQMQAHLTVPDDKKLMTESLQFLIDKSQWIFVTGGLGPTVDDFTRDVIAEYFKTELEFNPAAWQRVQDKLTSRGVPVREVQKSQCYFPKGSQILTNSKGTADGFYVKHNDLNLFVLPGPPKEIDAIWQQHIISVLIEASKDFDALQIHSWDLQGIGEGEISHKLAEEIKNCPFVISFRVHIPLVELKLTYPQSQMAAAKIWIEKIQLKIRDHVLAQ
jgi:nicotinamide-nucleotide amidase